MLDVACGSGAFVGSISANVKKAVGIDTNRSAIAQASRAGAIVYESSIVEFEQSSRGTFDVVTAFQVVEYLNSIMSFVESAYACVKPGGLLIVSVPNRQRRTCGDFESLDHPPHHITRWGESQLAALTNQLGAQLDTVEKQPMEKSQIIRKANR